MFAPAYPARQHVGHTHSVPPAPSSIVRLSNPPVGADTGVFRGTGSELLAQVRWNSLRSCLPPLSEPRWRRHIGPTHAAALERGEVRTFTITPEDVGLARVKPEALRGGDAKDNAVALLDVLKGRKGPYRDVAILNAAAGLVVAAHAKDLEHAVALATKAVDSGEAEGRLERLIAISNG